MKKIDWSNVFVGLFILAIIVYFIMHVVFTYFPARDNVEVQILEVQRVCKNNHCYWMLYDKNGSIYKIQDLWLIGYFNSGDIAGKLMSHKGETCIVETRGARIRILSLYPTITNIKNCFNNSTNN